MHPSIAARASSPWCLLRGAVCAAALLLLAGACRTDAADLSGGFGLDQLGGSDSHSNRGALAFASVVIAGSDLTVAVVRFDDTRVGAGYSGFLNAGIGVGSVTKLRAIGSRSAGEADYGAWRLRVGPEVILGPDWTVAAYYLHAGDTSPASLGALGLELGKPLRTTLRGQLGASIVQRKDGPRGAQAGCGLVWSAARNLQLLGEIDGGKSGMTTTSGSSSGSGSMPLPILNELSPSPSSTEASTEGRLEVVGLLGVRFLIP